MSNIDNPLRHFKRVFTGFFQGVDRFVSSHVRPHGIGCGEVACTELLAMCMSPHDSPPGLIYPAQKLVEDVNVMMRQSGVSANFKASASFHKFSQNHEGAVTQSDFAVQFLAKDSSDPNSFTHRKITFFQAKIVNHMGRYHTSPGQRWRMDQVRSLVGDTGLRYCLYNVFEQYGIGVNGGHPNSEWESRQKPWSAFMVDMLIEGYAEDELEQVPLDQQVWREKIVDSNEKANSDIAAMLGKDAKNWIAFQPAILHFEIDFPAYEYREIFGQKAEVGKSSAFRIGRK